MNDQKFLFHIGTIIPMLLTKAFQSTNLFLVFDIPLFMQECKCPSIFCIWITHSPHSNFIMFSLLVWFLSTYSLAKNLLVPHSLFYSSQLKNRNCMHTLTMKHLKYISYMSQPYLTIFGTQSYQLKYNIKLGNTLALKLLLL